MGGSRPAAEAAFLRWSLPRVLLALAVLVGVVGAPATLAHAETPGTLSVRKSVVGWTDGQTVEPGQTFTYQVTVGCTNIGSGGCTSATLTDTLPTGIQYVGPVSVQPTNAGTGSASGQTVTVDFQQPQTDPPGAIGINPGTTVTVQIPVRVDPDIDASLSGQRLTNTASAQGSNTNTATGQFAVVPDIPVELAASTDKSFDPDQGIEGGSDTTTMTLTGGNASNVPVDEIVITDSPNPPSAAFGVLDPTGTLQVTLPAGAEHVQVDVFVNGAWINGPPGPPPAVLPAGVSPADVEGVRVHFISTDGANIAPGAGGSLAVELSQDPAATAGSYANDIATTVAIGPDTSDPATADAAFQITEADLPLSASKSFDPDSIAVSGTSTVTLGATNTSSRTLDSLTIIEPGADPNMFTNGLAFSGWVDPVQWPAGATGASVTYTYADGSTETLTTSQTDTLPDPSRDPAEVVGFSVTFTGPIRAGAEASVPFSVTASPDQEGQEVQHPNTVSATSTAPGGYQGHDTAEDTLTTIAERLDVTVSKRVEPSSVPALPGQSVVALLTGEVRPFPASTTSANQIIVSDPSDPATSGWYDVFEPTAITETPVPDEATLTVEYWDGTQWVDVPGMVDIAGPTIFSAPLPADVIANAQGIRFVYESESGFPPGTKVTPNITYQVKDDVPPDSDAEIENCASASASSPTTDPAEDATEPPCPTVDLVPADGSGGFSFVAKGWDRTAIGERTGQTAGATLSWSTGGGLERLDQMWISDTPSPSESSLADSVYDAFDLVRIDPITASMDPLLTYDQVARVELFSRAAGAWITAPADPCPARCDGTFPGYTLTTGSGAGSRADTLAFRLVFQESPTRADRLNNSPTAPAVGSGVARSSGNNRRIHPVFVLRDELRSNPDVPVLASEEYNVPGSDGVVDNVVGADARVDDQSAYTDSASDTILITPVPVTANVGKTWSGNPMGLPAPGTATFPAQYPTGRVALTGSSTTPRLVDRLTITEPDAPGPGTPAEPFDTFNLARFVGITEPAAIGATDVSVTLTLAGGGTQGPLTRAQALALREPALTQVVGFTVVYTGRINNNAATVTFDTRLRPTHRSDGSPVTAGTEIPNSASIEAADLVDYPDVSPQTNTDYDGATMTLRPAGLGLAVTKQFQPDSQTEPDRSPVTLTLTGQPSGPTRTNWMSLVDEDVRFFNQYDFVGFGAFTFRAPINRVQVDAFVGGAFTDAGGAVERTGGSWVSGSPATALALPAGVNPADVQGLRFTFTRGDGAIWENPATPRQSVVLRVQRRVDLRSGGPVPSDLAGLDPAPSETVAGDATDTVQGENRSADTVNGQPLTAQAEAEDTISYKHATNSVEVTKSPSGAQAINTTIPYVLEFTNTGAVAISNPVITDRIPSDADGPLLVQNPEIPADGPYTYELDGAAPTPPAGPAMPTDPGQVTVQEDPSTLRFTFPPGTVLEPGQTYTITTNLMFRPGLPGQTQVTNTAGIVGDRPWDECSTSLDEETGECQASTTVNPIKAGAVTGVKKVKAEDPELGVLNTRNLPGGCIPDADGFYEGGCVPITKPGGNDIWRMTLTNTGNLPITMVHAIDRFPTPGDTGAISPVDRESKWTPGPKRVTFGGLTSGTISEVRIYYDTDQDLCTDDLGTRVGCPPGAWTLLGSFVNPTVGNSLELPADATAIRVEAEFPTALLQPTGRVWMDLITTAPAQSPSTGSDTIAWNTLAGAAETLDGDLPGFAPQTEGNKVGAALATGPVEVLKQVAGAGAQFAPTEFTLTLTCTSVGEDVDLGDDATLNVTAGEPTRVEGVPWGSECTVTEDTSSVGDPTFTATTVTVGRAPDLVTIEATNTYDTASLMLTKKVQDGAVDQDGNPISYGPFQFYVTCTFLDRAVFADGYSLANPMVATFGSGESVTYTGLPAGSSCAATEVDTAGATSTTSSATTGKGTADEESVTGDERIELVLTPDGAGGAVTNEVEFTNVFPTGKVTITKELAGDGAELWGSGPFTVHLTCVSVDDGRIVWDGDVVLGGSAPLTTTIDRLYVDSSCQATESGTGGATSVEVTPAGAFEVTADSATTPVVVTVTNTYDVGGLFILKLITGTEDPPEGLEFTLQAKCHYLVDGEQVEVPFENDGIFTLSPDYGMATGVYGLLVGTTCTVTELDSDGADFTAVVPDGPVVVGKDEFVSVIVINNFPDEPDKPTPPTTPPTTPEGPTPPDGELPATGGPGLRPLLWGLLFLLGGALVYTTSRRGRRD